MNFYSAARSSAIRAGQSLYRSDPRLVFYNAFQGHYADSPRAICERLMQVDPAMRHVWRRWPGSQRKFPPEVELAPRGSWTHARALARAQYVVTNTWLANDSKPRNTVWVQTWHGTPLKRIAFDIVKGLTSEDARRMSRDVAVWDYLVSPNPFSTEIFRSAFRFDGPILETGYPRNDLLSAPSAPQVRARVRRELEIDEGQTAVLYAPTWRDDRFGDDGKRAFPIPLDLDALDAQLGRSHVFLLRMHRAVSGRYADHGQPCVRNVTMYPDIRDLYLAADVLMTDYSSVMFDFAVTGKPMLFFANDLDTYMNDLRGFYFDFEGEVPGPLFQTTPELIEGLESLAEMTREHEARYADFRAKFCPLDDGHASDRVIDAVFGLVT